MQRKPYDFTVRLSLTKNQSIAEAGLKLDQTLRSNLFTVGEAGHVVLIHSVVAADPKEWLADAEEKGGQLWEDCKLALLDFYESEERLPLNLGELVGYGDDTFDPERQANDMYSIGDDLASRDGFLQACAIVDSGLFDPWETLDRGVWQDDDPRKALVNIAVDLHKRHVMEVASSYLSALQELFPFDVPLTDAIMAAEASRLRC